MKQVNQKLRWLLALTAVALGFLWAMQPARSECLSHSDAAGAAATTVYRCAEGDEPAAQRPIVVNPEKATVVERGSADVPWFEPKPTKTQDPIETAKKPPQKPEDVAKIDPAPPEVIKAKPAKPKIAKTKRTKAKVAKTKRTKAKVAKAKPTKAKLAKAKRTPPKAAKTQTAKDLPKAEPAKADEKVIVWTKKDMPIGTRIGNWLGF